MDYLIIFLLVVSVIVPILGVKVYIMSKKDKKELEELAEELLIQSIGKESISFNYVLYSLLQVNSYRNTVAILTVNLTGIMAILLIILTLK